VARLLNARLDELGRGLAWCYASILSQYEESQKLIQACGHDTSELEHAIDAAFKANLELEMARDNAVSRLKSDGICFLVDETRRRENEFSEKQLHCHEFHESCPDPGLPCTPCYRFHAFPPHPLAPLRPRFTPSIPTPPPSSPSTTRRARTSEPAGCGSVCCSSSSARPTPAPPSARPLHHLSAAAAATATAAAATVGIDGTCSDTSDDVTQGGGGARAEPGRQRRRLRPSRASCGLLTFINSNRKRNHNAKAKNEDMNVHIWESE
jgi:hypothetical protein